MATDYHCAAASAAAYDATDFAASGCEIRLVEDEDYLLIAFRGTTFDGLDILRDLRGIPWTSPSLGFAVHSGFLHGAIAIYPALKPRLVKEQAAGRRIFLTGHSKGGAEAVLIAALMARSPDLAPPDRLVTFGAPRVGFSGLSDIVADIPGRRYVFENDWIPRLPVWPFSHDRKIAKLAPPGRVPRRSWWRRSFLDHRIKNYVNALK